MNRRIAVYGKGGIGKSTVSANLTAALSDSGISVMQIGCDPKHDSTRGLIGGRVQNTVLDYLKKTPPAERKLDDVVSAGYKGCLCVEAGGPEPGVGCAGRGIISAFELLGTLGAGSVDAEVTIYDVLGDVVCGGFAVPLRRDYADTVYIVTSGEFMSIYAANNILRGTANYGPDRIGGIIFNSRGGAEEAEKVDRFADAVGVPVITRIPRSPEFAVAEECGMTVVEKFPDSGIAEQFRELASKVMEGKRFAARFLAEEDLEALILGKSRVQGPAVPLSVKHEPVPERRAPYASRMSGYGEVLNGCAFSGASSACTSVKGLTTILHSPRSCAHFTVQLNANCVKGACARGYECPESYVDPDAVCTDMDESDMIFGGGDVLRERVLSEISSGKKDLAVITACPPGIIGDNTWDICRRLEKEHGVRIAVIQEDGNAAGDFMQGVIDAGIVLALKFAVPGDTIPYSVNLVGVKTISSNAVSGISEVTSLLSEIGVGVNCVVPGMTSVADIGNISRASANLMLNGEVFTRKLCAFLGDQYGIDTIPEPVRGGLSGTLSWLRSAALRFGRADRLPGIEKKLRKRYASMVEGPAEILRGKTAWVISLDSDVAWIREALDMAGIEVRGAYRLMRGDHTSGLDPDAGDPLFKEIGQKDIAGIMDAINREKPDILLAPAAADADPSIYQSRLPCAPSTDPFAGRYLLEDLARGMLAPEREGWRDDAAR